MSKSKLQFAIITSPFKKTIKSDLVFKNKGTSALISINANPQNLLKFAYEYAKCNNIRIEKEVSNIGLNKTTIIKFNQPNLILSDFNVKDNEIFKKIDLKKLRYKGVAFGLSLAVTTVTYTSDANALNNINDYNTVAGITEVIKHDSNINNVFVNIADDITTIVSEQQIDETFEYSYDDRSESEFAINTDKYMYLFEEYGNMYGIDPNILKAKAAQESHGNPNANSNLAGGLMQIAYNNTNKKLTAYNFIINDYETITIDKNQLFNPEYSIKVGAMIFQNNLIDNNYDLAKALQSYNMGYGNVLALYNNYGDDWLEHRNMIHGGDEKYLEHVLSYLPSDTILTFTKLDDTTYTYKIINTESNVKVYKK